MTIKINASDLRSALITNQLKVFLQPKVKLDDHSIIGYEALMRWHHPEYGLISATKWVKIAEEHNLITPVTLWLLEECLKQVQLDVNLSINISVKSLTLDFAVRIINLLKAYKYPAHQLTLEITETQKIDNYNIVSGTLSFMRRQGVRISLDDFGTGYNTLKTLAELEVDEIKIDTSLMQSDSQNSKFILGMIISLAKEISLEVVCEGIETNLLLSKAREFGASIGQGYLFAKPCPIEISSALTNTQKKLA